MIPPLQDPRHLLPRSSALGYTLTLPPTSFTKALEAGTITHVDTEPHRQVLLGTMSSVPEQRTSEGFLSGQNTGSRGGKLQPLPLFLVFRGPWSWFTKTCRL